MLGSDRRHGQEPHSLREIRRTRPPSDDEPLEFHVPVRERVLEPTGRLPQQSGDERRYRIKGSWHEFVLTVPQIEVLTPRW